MMREETRQTYQMQGEALSTWVESCSPEELKDAKDLTLQRIRNHERSIALEEGRLAVINKALLKEEL